MDPFTAANGGTEIIPGSHLWGDAELGEIPSQAMEESPAGQERLAALARPVVIDPPTLHGQLTASHPKKALEEGYENRVVAQAREVGARLPE